RDHLLAEASNETMQVPHNKQLQRTVIPNRWHAASAPFHYAHAARWTIGRAAAELRRYAAQMASGAVRSHTRSVADNRSRKRAGVDRKRSPGLGVHPMCRLTLITFGCVAMGTGTTLAQESAFPPASPEDPLEAIIVELERHDLV